MSEDERDALLAMIRADLDDDAPRLVYADWLMSRGARRGELIAVQCELARRRYVRRFGRIFAFRGTPHTDPEALRLERRARKLTKGLRGELFGAIPLPQERVSVWRGFVSHVEVTMDELAAIRLLDVAPMLESITVTGPLHMLWAALANPVFQQVRALAFVAPREDASAGPRESRPTALRALYVGVSQEATREVTALLSSAAAANVDELSLSGWTAPAADVLAALAHGPRLRVLDLSHTRLRDPDLARLPRRADLEVLGLSALDASDRSLEELLAAAPRLHALDASGNHLTDASLPVLLRWLETGRVEHLDVRGNYMKDAARSRLEAAAAPGVVIAHAARAAR